jgi:NodT family efflux transporter outer membrane factor (OMF) lipoprotein
VEALPEAFGTAGTAGSYQPQAWWTSYGDSILDELVDSTLVANLDLAEAVARVEEARAIVGISAADLYPSLTGTAGASRQNNPVNAGFGAIIGAILGGGIAADSTGAGGESGEGAGDSAPTRSTIESFDAGIGLAYELDFWGRARAERKAALSDLAASASDFQVIQLGVLGETISAYFDLLDLQRRLRLTEEIVDVLTEREGLSATRYDRGLITSFELYSVRQDRQAAEASLPQLRAQIAEARSRLALVTGRHHDQLDAILGQGTSVEAADPPSQPVLPIPVPRGIPSDLLQQRPDVRASASRLEAARFRVGARKAELLPSINLTGTLGLQSSSAEGLFDLSQWFSNLAAGLTLPLFQGGRLRANLDAAEARYAQQLASHGRVVLAAVGEVEAAMVRHNEELRRNETLTGQLAEAESSVALQAERYEGGVGAYTDYLDALRVQLNTQATLSASTRDVALARLNLHRALGGTWAPLPGHLTRLSSRGMDDR